ncbi:DNA2 [Bugula neritina]|uniref:DNA replication ATP-dependent helicase/nuclease n=1 Tax=Bugula neritina TaxID=10212 RepID=A0A7J7JF08_BUGNE|nr:DNA2 [Bugula neritina]
MRLSNQLTYDMKLKCGTDSVKTATIPPISLDELDLSEAAEHSWTQKVVSSSLDHSLIWLNTSTCINTPSKKTSIYSNTEARVVCSACETLIQAGVAADSIGVITPYQAQVQLLKSMLSTSDVEVNTVDQYQGRDKSIIIISFARTEVSSNSKKTEGILSDARRLNVALTRAKHKLILVGNREVLDVYDPIYKLLHTLRPHQIINLPADPVLK